MTRGHSRTSVYRNGPQTAEANKDQAKTEKTPAQQRPEQTRTPRRPINTRSRRRDWLRKGKLGSDCAGMEELIPSTRLRHNVLWRRVLEPQCEVERPFICAERWALGGAESPTSMSYQLQGQPDGPGNGARQARARAYDDARRGGARHRDGSVRAGVRKRRATLVAEAAKAHAVWRSCGHSAAGFSPSSAPRAAPSLAAWPPTSSFARCRTREPAWGC
eukprot:scaffold1018_cov420-Prasinococcus_capsulatus_cf.AAC.2